MVELLRCLCYLISKGYTISEGFQQIKLSCKVASKCVMNFNVIKLIENILKRRKNLVR